MRQLRISRRRPLIGSRYGPKSVMDLLDRLLGHDAWTTKRLLDICAKLPDEQLDREFDIGHRTLRATLDHIIHNMEVWSSLMMGSQFERQSDRTISGMVLRLSEVKERLMVVARRTADQDGWDVVWTDNLDDPPCEKTFGDSIAHVITHSMHHRAQVLHMLRRSGVQSLPEGDVFSWKVADRSITKPSG